MASLRKRGRVWYYRFTDAEGVKQERRGCPDRRATEELARAAETEAAKIREGVIDLEAKQFAESGRRPIRDHLADYIGAELAKGNEPGNVRTAKLYATRVLELGEIGRITDLKESRVLKALQILRGRGLSTRTLNAHLKAIRALSRWLVREDRSLKDPLVKLKAQNEEADRRLVRRPLSAEELQRVIQTTRDSAPWRGVAGGDRVMFYTLAALTGLRRSELASLTPRVILPRRKGPNGVGEAGLHQEWETRRAAPARFPGRRPDGMAGRQAEGSARVLPPAPSHGVDAQARPGASRDRSRG